MNNEIKLGELITNDAQKDAVHVAIVPLVVGEWLRPGEKFRLKFGTADVALSAEYNSDNESHSPALGIIDPFIDDDHIHLKLGDRVWGILNPNSITGMRHEWDHPAFQGIRVADNEHEEWLRQFADKYNFDWSDMLHAAQDDDSYVVARGIDLHSQYDIEGDEEYLFWYHMEYYLGKKLEKNRNIWSCSC